MDFYMHKLPFHGIFVSKHIFYEKYALKFGNRYVYNRCTTTKEPIIFWYKGHKFNFSMLHDGIKEKIWLLDDLTNVWNDLQFVFDQNISIKANIWTDLFSKTVRELMIKFNSFEEVTKLCVITALAVLRSLVPVSEVRNKLRKLFNQDKPRMTECFHSVWKHYTNDSSSNVLHQALESLFDETKQWNEEELAHVSFCYWMISYDIIRKTRTKCVVVNNDGTDQQTCLIQNSLPKCR